jgi:hypothetical protein
MGVSSFFMKPERVGFEPTLELIPQIGFQDRLLKPLGHLSKYLQILDLHKINISFT